MHFALKNHFQYSKTKIIPRLPSPPFLWQSYTDPFTSVSCILNIDVRTEMLEREGVNLPWLVGLSGYHSECWTFRTWHLERPPSLCACQASVSSTEEHVCHSPAFTSTWGTEQSQNDFRPHQGTAQSPAAFPVPPQTLCLGVFQAAWGAANTSCIWEEEGKVPSLQLLNSSSIKIASEQLPLAQTSRLVKHFP